MGGSGSGESGRARRPGEAPLVSKGPLDPAKQPPQAAPRDYASLAALAGYTRAEFERLESPKREEARLVIERELAEKGEPEGQGELPRRARGSESSVWQDIREVEAGRKRQLGLDRP